MYYLRCEEILTT